MFYFVKLDFYLIEWNKNRLFFKGLLKKIIKNIRLLVAMRSTNIDICN